MEAAWDFIFRSAETSVFVHRSGKKPSSPGMQWWMLKGSPMTNQMATCRGGARLFCWWQRCFLGGHIQMIINSGFEKSRWPPQLILYGYHSNKVRATKKLIAIPSRLWLQIKNTKWPSKKKKQSENFRAIRLKFNVVIRVTCKGF